MPWRAPKPPQPQMRPRARRVASAGACAPATLLGLLLAPALALFSPDALAGPPGAMPGGVGPGGPGGPPQPGGTDEKEGPAEEAPKDKQALTPVVPVPARPAGFRQLQLVELHGYMRMRADYFHRLTLATVPTEDYDPKFFDPPVEVGEAGEINDAACFNRLTATGVSVAKATQRCARRRGMGGANMRLRLDPTLHVSDTVKVRATVDALDNLVLGSTPDSLGYNDPYAPIDIYTRTQSPPVAGINSVSDSITVKRAWGQIHFGWGLHLDFGRMPQHWGLGIVYNDGNGYDRGEKGDIVRMLDQDYGDTVDSVRLSYGLGKDRRRVHRLGVSYDWASSGPTTAQLFGPEWDSGHRVGQAFSVEKFDNVHQFSIFVQRRDDAAMLRRKLAGGDTVVNYGAMAWVRTQDIARAIGSPGLGDGLGSDATNETIRDPDALEHLGDPIGSGAIDDDGDGSFQNYANTLVHRRAFIVTPDLWLRLNWRTLRVEWEGAAVLGRYYHRNLDVQRTDADFDLDAVVADDRTWLRQFGYALEFKYGLFDDRFHIGLDQGMATGDESPNYELDPASPYHLQNGLDGTVGGDNTVAAFRFNPAYTQDLLLFREVLGTVSNSVYFRPWAAFYFFQDNASARLDAQFAFAPQRNSTPGRAAPWGVELDGAIRYHDAREPIFLQLQYGVLFPFGAFNADGRDAKAAQSVQAQVGIQF